MLQDPLHSNLSKYLENIDSLKYSLPILMRSILDELKKDSQELREFMDEHAIKLEGKQYQIETKYAHALERKRQTVGHLRKSVIQLPKNILISYVAYYDAFLGDLIKIIYSAKPELLNSCERELKFKDLVAFKNLDEAQEYILEKEIETLLRQSHEEQFKWMENKFNIPLTKDLDIWKAFIEITERRNLFVHTDGTISTQYIKKCKEIGLDVSDLKVGDKLSVDPKYMNEVYSVFYEICFKLNHVLWRKVFPNQLENSDNSMLETTFNLLKLKNYKLAIKLLDFSCETIKNHNSEINKRMFIINRAIAYKFSAQEDKCRELLKKHDWTATLKEFKLAVAVLEDRDEDVYKIMQEIGRESDLISNISYCSWPLFDHYRFKKEFQKTYKKIYKIKLDIFDVISLTTKKKKKT